MQEGFTPDEIRQCVTRDAARIEPTGKAGTEFVKPAKAFFGPSRHFTEEWAVPVDRNKFLQTRVSKKVMPLVWWVVQDIAALNRNTTYKKRQEIY